MSSDSEGQTARHMIARLITDVAVEIHVETGGDGAVHREPMRSYRLEDGYRLVLSSEKAV